MARGFTPAERRKGGWARARQHADWRRANPSKAEKMVQELLDQMGVVYTPEHEIVHPDGMPQWVDIMITYPTPLAIEIDGSHGWHCYNGEDRNGKMSLYDELKARLLAEAHIPLICINTSAHRYQWTERIMRALEEGVTHGRQTS